LKTNFSFEVATLPARFQYSGAGAIKTAQATGKPHAIVYGDENWKNELVYGAFVARFIDGTLKVEHYQGANDKATALRRVANAGAVLMPA